MECAETTFAYEYLYVKMQSTFGCKMLVRVVFPKEDMRDRKREQDAINSLNILNVVNKQKTKQQLDIEAKINRMILDPRLYEEFLEEFAIRKRKMMLEKAGANDTMNNVDIVKKNKKMVKDYQITNLEEKRLRQELQQQASALAKQRKQLIDTDKVKFRVLQMNKWAFIKNKRDQMEAAMDLKLRHVRRIRTLAKHTKIFLYLMQVWEKFHKKQVARRMYL